MVREAKGEDVMRGAWIIVLGMALAFSLSGCGGKNELLQGTYRFEKVHYLSLLSSSTKDYVNSLNEDTEYVIHEDVFRIIGPEETMELESPEYVREEVKESSGFIDLDKVLQDIDAVRYVICDKDGNRSRWSLYVSGESLWIGRHNDLPDGRELLFDLYIIRKTGP